MTGKQQPERIGPWYPADIPEAHREELRRLARAVELSGHTLDWYGARDGDGNRIFEALVLTVEEKQQLDGETNSSRARREQRNLFKGLPVETNEPDIRLHPLRWTLFREQAGIRKGSTLVDAISAAVQVKHIEIDSDSWPTEPVTVQVD